MNSVIKIKFWGVRGSTPCANNENMGYGGNTTCIQIDIPETDELLVLDCGTGFRNLGNVLANNGEALRGRVFITHPHWDHLQGFPFFKPFYDSKNWFRIYLPPQGEINCREILQGHMSSTFFPVSIDMLEANLECENFQPGKKLFENYSMEYIWATHTVPTAMYKIRIGSKIIVFAPDNELMDDGSARTQNFEQDFRDFIHGIDLLIHDAQFTKEQYKYRRGWGHSAWQDIVRIASEEKVEQLCLTHHDPDNDDEKLAGIEKEIKANYTAHFEGFSLAKEGQVITLPYKEQEPKKVTSE